MKYLIIVGRSDIEANSIEWELQINRYRRYLEVFTRYIKSKGYDIEIVRIDFPISTGWPNNRPDHGVLMEFSETFKAENICDYPVYILPYGETTHQVGGYMYARYPDEIGYSFMPRTTLVYDNPLGISSELSGTCQEICHLVLFDPLHPELATTHIIDIDPEYVGKTEDFEGFRFQKIPGKVKQ